MTDIYTIKQKANSIARVIKKVIIFLAVVIVLAEISDIVENLKAKENDELADSDITTSMIESRIRDSAELITQVYSYSNIKRADNYKQLFGHDLGITKHTVEVSYSGKINVGFNLDEVSVNIIGDEILINLPKPYIIDNYIDISSVTVFKDNNIFNKIKDEEVDALLEGVKEAELQNAIDSGLYDKAKGQAKRVIEGLLMEFDGYHVRFI